MAIGIPNTGPMRSEDFAHASVTRSAVERIEQRLTRSFLPAITVACIGLAFAQFANSRQAETNRAGTSKEMHKAILAIRGAYAAFNRGDFEAAVAPLDPEIEWTEPAQFPGGGTYHGRDAVKGYLSQSRAGWMEGSSKPERFIVAGNRIIVFVFARFIAKGTNQWHETKLADVYTIRGGKIVQMNAFADRAQALRWAGAKSS